MPETRLSRRHSDVSRCSGVNWLSEHARRPISGALAAPPSSFSRLILTGVNARRAPFSELLLTLRADNSAKTTTDHHSFRLQLSSFIAGHRPTEESVLAGHGSSAAPERSAGAAQSSADDGSTVLRRGTSTSRGRDDVDRCRRHRIVVRPGIKRAAVSAVHAVPTPTADAQLHRTASVAGL